MILTGSPITAGEAHSARLVAEVFPPQTVLEKTIEQAATLATLSPGALAMAKAAISRGMSYFRKMQIVRRS